MTNGELRALTFDDEENIINLITTSISYGDNLHIGHLLPTEKNVNAFFKFEIFDILFEDDPNFGFFYQGELLGLSCCSTKINKIYQLKEKTAMGTITVVHPQYRRKGIGSKLRLAVIEQLKKLGFKRFIFEIKHDNEASLDNAKKIADKLKVKSDLISFKFEGHSDVF
jgi:GNAT superfamily N-acetyltransferase